MAIAIGTQESESLQHSPMNNKQRQDQQLVESAGNFTLANNTQQSPVNSGYGGGQEMNGGKASGG